MIAELEHGVEEQGMKWDDYLSSLKKTKDELKLEFVPQAIRRIQTAIFIKHLARKQNIVVSDEELDQEVDRILSQLRPNDTETRERISSASIATTCRPAPQPQDHYLAKGTVIS